MDANQQLGLEFYFVILANSSEGKKFSGWICEVAVLSFVCS